MYSTECSNCDYMMKQGDEQYCCQELYCNHCYGEHKERKHWDSSKNETINLPGIAVFSPMLAEQSKQPKEEISAHKYIIDLKLSEIEELKIKFNKWRKYFIENAANDEIVSICGGYLQGIFRDIKRLNREIEDEQECERITNTVKKALSLA